MSKQFLHMQKLAGLITESEYRKLSNEGLSLKKGIASMALATALACAPSCKVKDTEDTLKIQQTEYSNHKDSYVAGDEIGIQLMPQNQSHIKNYKIVVSDINHNPIKEYEGNLKDAGAYINYRIPKNYNYSVLNITLYGTNILNKEFQPIERNINITK